MSRTTCSFSKEYTTKKAMKKAFKKLKRDTLSNFKFWNKCNKETIKLEKKNMNNNYAGSYLIGFDIVNWNEMIPHRELLKRIKDEKTK